MKSLELYLIDYQKLIKTLVRIVSPENVSGSQKQRITFILF